MKIFCNARSLSRLVATSAAGRADVDAESAAAKTVACATTAAFLAAVAAGYAAVFTAGVANATFLAVAGGTAGCRAAVAANGGAALQLARLLLLKAGQLWLLAGVL